MFACLQAHRDNLSPRREMKVIIGLMQAKYVFFKYVVYHYQKRGQIGPYCINGKIYQMYC